MSAGCKPGRHAARCAGCNKRFGVIVPEDAGEPIVTVALDAEVGPDEATVSDSVRKTARREGPVEKLRAVEATVSYAPAEGTRAANAIEPAEPGPYAATRVSVPGFPRRLGGYEIRKELGRGGMGAVYLARQVSLDRNVALKVMKPEWTRNAQFLARFTREAFAAAQLVHHNMVQIYDIGSDRGVHYFTMEFVQGSSLGEVAKREGK
ncbi:MAG: protein kinase, partial [Candidatus Brocadiia bacterium]|nr:protein kinase [Candidatus Brocadiia bacterium]